MIGGVGGGGRRLHAVLGEAGASQRGNIPSAFTHEYASRSRMLERVWAANYPAAHSSSWFSLLIPLFPWEPLGPVGSVTPECHIYFSCFFLTFFLLACPSFSLHNMLAPCFLLS